MSGALVCCCCCWICGRSVSGSVNITEIGSSCVTTHEAVGVGRVDDVADVDLTDAGDAIDRRGQARVAELNVRGVDQRLIGFDGALQLRHLRLLGVQQLRRGPALLLQRRVAVEIGQRIRELGLIAIAVCRQLFDLRLIGTRIDLREQIAGMDGLPLGEVDADDLALDLARTMSVL